MVQIMVSMWWAPGKGIEIAKKGIEAAKKFPADETIATTLATGFMGDKIGTKAITIANVPEGKLEEALTRTREILNFYGEVGGVTAKIDIMLTVEEAYASVDMKPPE